MREPAIALDHWIRVLKPGGHLVMLVPDEDLYEQGVFPSTFNTDHKWTFTISKLASWSPRSLNVTDLMNGVSDRVQTLKVELLDHSYRFVGIRRLDQTLTPVAECAIEIVARKWTADDLALRGRIRRADTP
jgi:SAM-dependent methyltransferase